MKHIKLDNEKGEYEKNIAEKYKAKYSYHDFEYRRDIDDEVD